MSGKKSARLSRYFYAIIGLKRANFKTFMERAYDAFRLWITESQLSARCQFIYPFFFDPHFIYRRHKNVQKPFKNYEKVHIFRPSVIWHGANIWMAIVLSKCCAPKHQLDENKYFMCKYCINANGTHFQLNKRLNLYDSCVVMDVITQISHWNYALLNIQAVCILDANEVG